MARIRTIKPEFWTSEKITECSLSARLLFIGLWNFADDEGRMEDKPKRIKMQVFPGDDITSESIHGLLTELSVNDLIIRYTVEDKDFIQIKGWDHQKINRALKSKFPEPSLSDHGGLSEQTQKKLPETEPDNSEKEKEPPLPPKGDVDRAYELWNELSDEYPKLPKAKNKDGPTRKRLATRLKEEGLDGFNLALQGIRASPHHRNEGKWNGMNLAWLVNPTNFEKLQMMAGAPRAAPEPEAETAADRALRRAREIEGQQEGSAQPEHLFLAAGGMR